MKIQMTTCLVGKDFVHNRGDIVEVNNDEAQRLIKAEYATPYTAPAAVPAKPPKKKTQPKKIAKTQQQLERATEPQDIETPEE